MMRLYVWDVTSDLIGGQFVIMIAIGRIISVQLCNRCHPIKFNFVQLCENVIARKKCGLISISFKTKIYFFLFDSNLQLTSRVITVYIGY